MKVILYTLFTTILAINIVNMAFPYQALYFWDNCRRLELNRVVKDIYFNRITTPNMFSIAFLYLSNTASIVAILALFF